MFNSLVVRPLAITLRAFLLFAVCIGSVLADEPAQAEPTRFDIEQQSLKSALTEFARQSDREILYSTDVVANKEAPTVEGVYEPEEALDLLLADTGLDYSVTASETFLVNDAGGDRESGNVSPTQLLMAQNQAPATQKPQSQQTRTSSNDDEQPFQIEEIIVTGTHIRGLAPDSSPVRMYSREDILASGAATAQDFIRLLPQNFSGGSNENFSALPNDNNSGFNSSSQGSLGSSINLRGLGSGGTLVLLNGRRVAPSSGIGDFVDISMIPASAIERVDVLTDGASSIYGADAVAGVVNFVLRDDFEGIEASLRYGSVTDGNFEEQRYGITGGTNWNGGNGLLVYEFFDQSNLSTEDRTFTQGAPLPSDLLPSQERHSVVASASQELSPTLEAFGDILFSKRDAERDTSNAAATFHSKNSSENLNVSLGIGWDVTDTWYLDVSATYSDIQNEANLTDLTGPDSSERESDSDLWTVDAKASGTLFQMPGGDMKLAVGGHYREESFSSFRVDTDTLERDADRDVVAVFGEVFIPIVGFENAVSGIRRLEANVSGRFEDYSDFGTTTNPKVGVLWSPVENLNIRTSYSESFSPPPLGRVGATDLRATIARTSLSNLFFGLTPADPSIEDVVALHVFGTARELDAEESKAFTAGFDFSVDWKGGHSLSFTAGYFDIEFENRLGDTPIPGNAVGFDAHNIAFDNPELFPEGTILFFPSPDVVSDLVNSLDRSTNIDGSDPFAAEIINFAGLVRNLAQTSVNGFDFDIAYTYESDVGDLSLSIDGTFLNDFEQQAAVTTPVVEQLDTLFNPVGLKLRGRVGFATGSLATNLFVNYTDSYSVDNSADATKIDSWTTLDLSLSYDTENTFESSILDNAVLRLSIHNLLDEDPPETPGNPSFLIFGYDPTNASELNRFVSLEIAKRF